MDSLADRPLTDVPGLGPSRAETLTAAHGLETQEDLLRFFPRKYVDRSNVISIRQLNKDVSEERDETVVVAEITGWQTKRSKSGSNRLEVYLKGPEGGTMRATWFRGLKVKHAFSKGAVKAFIGPIKRYGRSLSMTHPDFYDVGPEALRTGTISGVDSLHVGNIVPFYPGGQAMESSGLSSKVMRQVMSDFLHEIDDVEMPVAIPPEVEDRFDLMDGALAYRAAHFPFSFDELDEAVYRLKLGELFLIQTVMAKARQKRSQTEKLSEPALRESFVADLPFELTGAQKSAIADIVSDMESGMQMNRLLQGDVGSGKTVVAVAAMLQAIGSGKQTAFMAPTQVLAEQHYQNLCSYLEPLGLETTLLTGSLTAEEQREARYDIREGYTDVAVGTHALIEDDTEFDDLGLAVIDEQHRFGVRQRQEILESGQDVHMLLTTATPIPRSLALSMYGDLDESVMDEMPPGRKPVQTEHYDAEDWGSLMGKLQAEIDEGNQVFAVCPLIEPSPQMEGVTNVKSEFKELQRELRAGVEFLHGRMKPAEKNDLMDRFSSGDFDVLVSTTVIEVGVDIPGATVMLVEDANQFGLSQLHQLRGRVGRSEKQSYCYLVTDGELTADAEKRIEAMTETNDGFEISQVDLQIRGAGEFLSEAQSGNGLRMADLTKDGNVAEDAGEVADYMVESDPSLASYGRLPVILNRRLDGADEDLAQVG